MAAGAMEEVRADLPAAETETVRGVRIQAEATDEAATEEMAVLLETVMEETAGRADLPAAAMETVTEEPAVSEEETEETAMEGIRAVPLEIVTEEMAGRVDLPAAAMETVTEEPAVSEEETEETAMEGNRAVPLEIVMEEARAALETETAAPADLAETVTAVPEALAAEARIRTGIPETEATVTAAVLAEETAVVLPPLTVLSRQSQAAPVRPTRMLIRMTVLTRETGMRTERRHQRQERELSLCRSLRRKRQRLRM